jgi:hypothetical protein
LGGENVRESLNLTVWGAAQERVRGWEASGQIGVVKNETPDIAEAVQKHVADAEARNLKVVKVGEQDAADSAHDATTSADKLQNRRRL